MISFLHRSMAAFLLAATVFVGPSLADEDSVATELDELRAAIELAEQTRGLGHPAMWRLQDEDTVIYMLGSVHVWTPDADWRFPLLDTAFKEADYVVFESDEVEDDPESDEFLRLMAREGFFRDGTRLTDLLSEEDERIVRDGLAIVHLPLEAVNAMKPWNASITSGLILTVQMGYDFEYGVDSTIRKEAERAGKPIGSLETAADAFEALSAGTLEEQVEAFVYGASIMELAEDLSDTMFDEWSDGDVVGLLAVVNAGDSSIGVTSNEALLDGRNRNWVPQIIAMLDKPGTILIVAGAAHFVGENSVVDLLEKEGYTIEGPL